MSLSVGVAVTTALSTNVQERLAWLEYVLQTVNLVVRLQLCLLILSITNFLDLRTRIFAKLRRRSWISSSSDLMDSTGLWSKRILVILFSARFHLWFVVLGISVVIEAAFCLCRCVHRLIYSVFCNPDFLYLCSCSCSIVLESIMEEGKVS